MCGILLHKVYSIRILEVLSKDQVFHIAPILDRHRVGKHTTCTAAFTIHTWYYGDTRACTILHELVCIHEIIFCVRTCKMHNFVSIILSYWEPNP